MGNVGKSMATPEWLDTFLERTCHGWELYCELWGTSRPEGL